MAKKILIINEGQQKGNTQVTGTPKNPRPSGKPGGQK